MTKLAEARTTQSGGGESTTTRMFSGNKERKTKGRVSRKRGLDLAIVFFVAFSPVATLSMTFTVTFRNDNS